MRHLPSFHTVFFLVLALGSSFVSLLMLSQPALAANVRTPEWWGNVNPASCDPAHFSGSSSLGQWDGFASCQPQGTLNGVYFTRGGSTYGAAQDEWQCVELAMRYMMLAWGVQPYGADGDEVVENWNNSATGITPVDISNKGTNYKNNTNGQVPSIGDVISFGQWGESDGGHVAIITDVRQLSGTGNYAFTFFDQNDNSNPYHMNQLTMSDWVFTITGLKTPYVNGWLHQANGNMTGYMAGINPPSGDKQVFTVNRSGQVATSWQCSGSNCTGGWANWTVLNPTSGIDFPPTEHLGVVMNQAGTIEVFGTDVNNDFWHMWGQQGSFSSWYKLSGGGASGTASDITAGNYDNSNDIVLWITYTDGHPYYMYSTNGSWSGWSPYSNATFPLGTRYIIGHDNSSVNVLALGADGKIYSNYTPWGSGNGWSSAFAVFGDLYNGVGFATEPATVTRDSSGDEEIFASRSDGTVWHNYEQNGSFQGWMQISSSPQIKTNIAATQTLGQIPEIYARDPSSWVWHNWNNGSPNSYSGWNEFSSGIPFSGDVNVISNGAYYPEIFVTASDGKSYHQWLYTSNGTNYWSGWQSLANGSAG